MPLAAASMTCHCPWCCLWYEQKAACILLTLLHLGIQNIRLGPTLPAFLSPKVLALLTEQYHIAPTTTPEADLSAMLG